jgi:A/G-specific adenine glycosylase
LSFTEQLIRWQASAGRHDLPWQKTQDAYRIWLSEIMLQQTQVSTVMAYYARFLNSFPDVQTLAAAPIEAVLTHWAGLGYYARARNLHRCARSIVEQHAGKFPDSPEILMQLPGIGRSTAAAIAAFAYGKKAAILDGNVKRVLCRQFAIDGFPGLAAVDRKLWSLAENLLPTQGIEAYTQGLMDLGATLCTRSKPRCAECPVSGTCCALREQRQDQLPTARPKKTIPEKSACFVLISDGQRLLLERRPASGIWGGLLVPPEGEPADVLLRYGLKLRAARHLPPLRHTFTHFKLILEPILCQVEAPLICAEAGMEWVNIEEAAAAGVPTPIGKLIRQVASAAD